MILKPELNASIGLQRDFTFLNLDAPFAHEIQHVLVKHTILVSLHETTTVEPRYNEVPRDWGNLFVISRVRCIENLDITNLWKNNQNVRYIEV